jgi:multidrug efflux pump subunit AcrB
MINEVLFRFARTIVTVVILSSLISLSVTPSLVGSLGLGKRLPTVLSTSTNECYTAAPESLG